MRGGAMMALPTRLMLQSSRGEPTCQSATSRRQGASMSDPRLIVTEADADAMVNPGFPTPPSPGKMPPPKLPPDSLPPEEPEDEPDIGPTGPHSPYPGVDPSIDEPPGPGSE